MVGVSWKLGAPAVLTSSHAARSAPFPQQCLVQLITPPKSPIRGRQSRPVTCMHALAKASNRIISVPEFYVDILICMGDNIVGDIPCFTLYQCNYHLLWFNHLSPPCAARCIARSTSDIRMMNRNRNATFVTRTRFLVSECILYFPFRDDRIYVY
ncbi:hypothetical protein F4859DRAFT_477781, partial [Xylaria cf. heliscus]